VGDSWFHEAVCRQRPELWVTVGYMKLFVDTDLNYFPIFCAPILTIFEVTERSVSSSLLRKAQQQSIAVLRTTLFSRLCHCSTISVQIV